MLVYICAQKLHIFDYFIHQFDTMQFKWHIYYYRGHHLEFTIFLCTYFLFISVKHCMHSTVSSLYTLYITGYGENDEHAYKAVF